MIDVVLELVKNPTRENCLKFLNETEKIYQTCPEAKKEKLIQNIQEDMMYFIFLAIETYQKKLQEETHVYLFSQKDHYYYLFFRLMIINENNFLETIKELKELYLTELTDAKCNILSDDIRKNILLLAEERYQLISFLNTSESDFYFLNIPFANKISESHLHWFEKQNGNFYIMNLYGTQNPNCSLAYSFACFIGESLYFYLKEKQETLLIKIMKRLKKSKEPEIITFASSFALALLRFTPYEENTVSSKEKEKCVQCFEMMIQELNEKHELNLNEICPCGSNKKYQDCCKKRELEWWVENGKIIRRLPMLPTSLKQLKKYKKYLHELLGRTTYHYEKIWSIVAGPEMQMEYLISKLPNKSFSLAWKYAALKTDMMMTPINQLQFTELDEQEWQEAIEEFYQKDKQKLSNGKSIFQNIKEINETLSEISKYIEQVISVLNIFLNKIGNRYSYQNFIVKEEKDFAIVCSRKLAIDGHLLQNGLKNKSIEEVTNMTRIIYEDLIQTAVLLQNKELFQTKIIPLTKLEKGSFKYKENPSGTKSKHILVNPQTKEEFNIKINIKDLSLKSQRYNIFYDELFDGLSSFIHLNISKIPHYFQTPNPLTEVQNDLETGLLGLFFLNQSLYELRYQCEEKSLILRDMEYVYYQVSQYILKCLKKLEIVETENEIYQNIFEIQMKCLGDLKKENLVNLKA